MRKVVINVRTRYIISELYTPNQKGWRGVRFLNKQEGLYNVNTGEIIDQIDDRQISRLGSVADDGLVDIVFEDGKYQYYDCHRRLLLPYEFGYEEAYGWPEIIETRPEAFQYLPSEYFYENKHMRNADHTGRGYIDIAFDAVEADRYKFPVDEFKERCEKIKAIIANKLEEEKDAIEAGEKVRTEEARAKAENERLEKEKTNILANARKSFTDESEA